MADNVQKVSRVEDIYVFTKTGSVTDCGTTSKTSVHGYGGGANRQPIQISSTTTETLKMFVREDDGDEFEVSLHNPSIGVRPGHLVTIGYAGDQVSKRGFAAALWVHNTGNSEIYDQRINWAVQRTNGWAATGLILLGLAAGVLFQSGVMAFLGLAIALGYLVSLKTKHDAVFRAMKQELTQAMAEAAKTEKARKAS